MAAFSFYSPTRLLFAPGALSQLGDAPLPGKRALIVTTGGTSVKANGYLARVEAELDRAGVSHVLFDRIEPNPLRATVNAGGMLAHEEGCDFILALGGGSVMDGCKGICTMAANPFRTAADGSQEPGDVWDYAKGGTAKGLPIPVRPLPLVCVTTTAGTGSEVNAGAIVSCEETNEKLRLNDPTLYPVIAVADPELMLTVPPTLTAYQGFDALFHDIECFISAAHTRMGDMFCREGVANAASALPVCVDEGDNIDARTRLAWASILAGYAMDTSGTTGCHAIEHAMSAHHHELPHGAGLIMIAAAYHGHMISAHACDERYVELARLMGNAAADKPEDFLVEYARLTRACHVDNLKMSDWGIEPAEFEAIANNAFETTQVLFDRDPAPLDRAAVIEILQQSYR